MPADIYANLKGKTALITGASSGIGAALARRLAAHGVNVVCTARTQSNLDSVAKSITDAGGSALAFAADATVSEDTEKLAQAIEAEYGGLDLAYLNAGGNWQKASIEDSDISAWREAINQNLLSFFLGVRLAAPLMRNNGGGQIILTGSAMAHYPTPGNSSYCAGKSAARMVANIAALELIDDNITVNEFIPGPVRSKQALDGLTKEDKNSPFNNPKEWVKEPEDVTEMLLFMAAYPGMGPTSQIFSLARR